MWQKLIRELVIGDYKLETLEYVFTGIHVSVDVENMNSWWSPCPQVRTYS